MDDRLSSGFAQKKTVLCLNSSAFHLKTKVTLCSDILTFLKEIADIEPDELLALLNDANLDEPWLIQGTLRSSQVVIKAIMARGMSVEKAGWRPMMRPI